MTKGEKVTKDWQNDLASDHGWYGFGPQEAVDLAARIDAAIAETEADLQEVILDAANGVVEAIAEEREACARVAEAEAVPGIPTKFGEVYNGACVHIAAAIRARTGKP